MLPCVIVVAGRGERDELEQMRSFLSGSADLVVVEPGDAPFNLGAAYNRGVHVRPQAEWYLFLHDDVTLIEPDIATVGRALQGRGVGMAVPMVAGRCYNPAQSAVDSRGLWSAIPYFHISEYVDPCAVAVRADRLLEAGGWAEDLTGYGWWAVELQGRMARRGWSAVVVPSALVRHADQGAYIASGLDVRDAFYRDVPAVAARLGIHAELKRRLSEPRFTPWNYGRPPASSVVALVSAEEHLDRLRSWPVREELVVVDCSDNPCGIGELTRMVPPVRYAPRWDLPRRQGVNLAGGRQIELVDFTGVSDGQPPKVTVERRLRTGDRYELASQIEELHVAMMDGMGIGDTLMATAALRKIRTEHPYLRLVVHHGWSAGQVLENNPDIHELYQHQGEPPPASATFLVGVGVEGTLHHHFAALSCEPATDAEKRVHYHIREQEHDEAVAKLHQWGCPDNPYLVGVQLHGNWQVKQWAHTNALIDRLLSDGTHVVAFGSDATRCCGHGSEQERMPVPGLFWCINEPLRHACAIIGILDAWIGFDSGFAYVAGAVGTPSVTIWGSNDPRGFLLDTDPENAVTLRKRTPDMCEKQFGRNCRKEAGGSRCPLRGPAEPGSLCLDEIGVDDVLDQLRQFPRWHCNLEERYRRHA